MAHEFAVYTKRGKHDSLEEAISIAFTLTPVESRRATCSYDPLAFFVMDFDSDSSENQQFDWEPRFGFKRYEITESDEGEVCNLKPGKCFGLDPGESVTMKKGRRGEGVSWADPEEYHDNVALKQSSVVAVNATGSRQEVQLWVKRPSASVYSGAVAFHPLSNGSNLVVPTKLLLQAYIVSNTIHRGDILRAEDRTRPLFDVPLRCDGLKSSSTWRLYEGRNGDIRLRADDGEEIPGHSIESLASSIGGIQGQLSELLGSFAATQERLAAVEKSVKRTRSELASTKKSLAAARQELERLDYPVPGIEAKTSQMERRIARAEKSITRIQGDIAANGEDMGSLRSQLSIVEDVSALQESLQSALDKFSASGPRVEHENLVKTDEIQPLDRSSEHTKVDTERSGLREPALGTQRGELASFSDEAELDVAALRAFGKVMNRRVPALEATTERLDRATNRMREDASTALALVAEVGDQVSRLDGRVAALEARTDKLSALADPEERGSPELEESPMLFPSRLPPEPSHRSARDPAVSRAQSSSSHRSRSASPKG